MKAKEWIQHLITLDVDGEEFQKQVAILTNECQAILQLRLPKQKPKSAFERRFAHEDRQVNDKMFYAFREAHVKWDAVCHGVLMHLRKTDPEALPVFPLFRGAFLFTILSTTCDEYRSNPTKSNADVYKTFYAIAERSGYKDEKVFIFLHDMFESITRKSLKDTTVKVKAAVDEMMVLMLEPPSRERDAKMRRISNSVSEDRIFLIEACRGMSPMEKMTLFMSV